MQSGNELDSVIRPLLRRLNLAVWLDASLPAFLALMAAAATAMILAKTFLPELARLTRWFFLPAPLALFWGFIAAGRKKGFYSPAQAAEVLDRAYRDDGSVTAFFEKPSLNRFPGWCQGLRAASPKKFPSVSPGHYAYRAMPALAYALAAMLAPQAQVAENAQARELLSSVTGPLVRQVEEHEAILPEKEKKEILAALKDLAQSPEGISAESWEAAEALSERVKDAVARSAGQAAGIGESLGSALNQAKALEGGKGSAKALDEALKELARKAGARGCRLPGNMAQRLSGMAGGSRAGSSRELARLEKDLQSLKSEMENFLQKAHIEKGPGECRGGAGCASAASGPGRGGLTRGRADAPMALGKTKNVPEAKFRMDRLENNVAAPSELVDTGVLPVSPKPDPGKFSPGALRAFESRTGPVASQTRITPVQKDVVARYFSEDQ